MDAKKLTPTDFARMAGVDHTVVQKNVREIFEMLGLDALAEPKVIGREQG